jgi:hypothetical protein
MRAILINPIDHTVTETEYSGDYKHIYELIDVDTFTIIHLQDKNRETMFLDDNGLLKPNRFFKWHNYGQPLAGKALILGTDDEGESIGTKLTLDFVKEQVTFLTPKDSAPQDREYLARIEVRTFDSPEEFFEALRRGE